MKIHLWALLLTVLTLGIGCVRGGQGDWAGDPGSQPADTVPVYVTVDVLDEAEESPRPREPSDVAEAGARLSAVLGAAAVGGVIGAALGLVSECEHGRDRACPRRRKAEVTDAVTSGVVGASIGALAGWFLFEAGE